MVYQRSVRYRPTAVGAGDACASKDRKKRGKTYKLFFHGADGCQSDWLKCALKAIARVQEPIE